MTRFLADNKISLSDDLKRYLEDSIRVKPPMTVSLAEQLRVLNAAKPVTTRAIKPVGQIHRMPYP